MAPPRVIAAFAGTPSVVIPAKAGIHRLSPIAHGGAPDTPIASVPSDIPAKAGIHRCSPITDTVKRPLRMNEGADDDRHND